MPSSDCEEELYQKAVAAGVKFSKDELEEMGHLEEDDEENFLDLNLDSAFTEKEIAEFEANVSILCDRLDQLYPPKPVQPKRKGLGFFGTLFAVLGAFAGADDGKKKKKDTGRCDGDCANCPPHYGYRYGRWYYGHGHRYGCTRGGNGGV